MSSQIENNRNLHLVVGIGVGVGAMFAARWYLTSSIDPESEHTNLFGATVTGEVLSLVIQIVAGLGAGAIFLGKAGIKILWDLVFGMTEVGKDIFTKTEQQVQPQRPQERPVTRSDITQAIQAPQVPAIAQPKFTNDVDIGSYVSILSGAAVKINGTKITPIPETPPPEKKVISEDARKQLEQIATSLSLQGSDEAASLIRGLL